MAMKGKAGKAPAPLKKTTRAKLGKKIAKGQDVGRKGKMFETIAEKAAEKYGSLERGRKVAAAAMWKTLTKGWKKGKAGSKGK